MPYHKNHNSYVDAICKTEDIERIVAVLQSLLARWDNLTDIEKLTVWQELSIDDYFRALDNYQLPGKEKEPSSSESAPQDKKLQVNNRYTE